MCDANDSRGFFSPGRYEATGLEGRVGGLAELEFAEEVMVGVWKAARWAALSGAF